MKTKLVWTMFAAGTMLAGCATTPTTMAPMQQAAASAVYHVQGGTPAPEPVPTEQPTMPTQPEQPTMPQQPQQPPMQTGPGCGTCVFPLPLPTVYNYGFDWLDGVLARQSDYLAGCHGFAGCGQPPAPPAPAPQPQPHTK